MKFKKIIIAFITICVLAGCAVSCKYNPNVINYLEQSTSDIALNSDSTYEVIRVVDGDTIVINDNGQKVKVRLIGINTPESVHADAAKNTELGRIASDYTKQQLTGKTVTLEFDAGKYDKYDRLLAYVYLDGQMFNETLLINGYAKTMTIEPNTKYAERFKTLEQQARDQKIGIWA